MEHLSGILIYFITLFDHRHFPIISTFRPLFVKNSKKCKKLTKNFPKNRLKIEKSKKHRKLL